jgi:hypothetical protein
MAVAVCWLMLGAAGRAEADLVVDQQQTIQNGTGLATYSIGQSFTPTATLMDTVEFKLFSEGSTTLQLAILDGLVGDDGLGGTVLGTSAAVTITNTTLAPIDFQLTSPLSVVPGHTYVAELIFQGGAYFDWAQEGKDLYAGGQMLQANIPTGVLNSQDFVFREGLSTTVPTPEPSTALVAAFGAVAFLAYGWSRHRRAQQRQAAA